MHSKQILTGGSIIKTIISILVFLACIVLLIAISTAAFVAAGYLLSLILPVTVFQSSVLCIGATFVFAFIISAVTIAKQIFDRREYDKMQYAYEDEDEDDDDDDDEYVEKEENTFDNVSHRRFTVVNKRKVGRNEPCPCGSGKKYKHCCGK
ncbi:MAG: SEC-C domain-containing protein [Deltaproteobacteria bacterium]|nr:SEC-C domain-containing protein [Deltaproteobacteria bacterium]